MTRSRRALPQRPQPPSSSAADAGAAAGPRARTLPPGGPPLSTLGCSSTWRRCGERCSRVRSAQLPSLLMPCRCGRLLHLLPACLPRPRRRPLPWPPCRPHACAGPLEAQHRIYLSAATLVVVPPPLVTHWQEQARRHVAGGGLRVVVYTAEGGWGGVWETCGPLRRCRAPPTHTHVRPWICPRPPALAPHSHNASQLAWRPSERRRRSRLKCWPGRRTW